MNEELELLFGIGIGILIGFVLIYFLHRDKEWISTNHPKIKKIRKLYHKKE